MRLTEGKPKIIDLFAGVGGFSLGAVRAGFDVVAAVEKDPIANATHVKNFPKTKHLLLDISCLSAVDLLAEAGIEPGGLDGLIGGPPCQGFSRMGRADANDQRNGLFHDFFRLVSETEPRFFVAENVPGIMDEKHALFRNMAFELVADAYTIMEPAIITASDYGAATSRTRTFFFGFKRTDPCFRDIDKMSILKKHSYGTLTVASALNGLPECVEPEWQTEEQSWRVVQPPSDPKLADLFQGKIPEGVGDPDAINRLIERGEVSGFLGTRHSPEVEARFATVSPGKQDPISKAYRLDPEGFCPTLRAGTDRAHGSFQAVRPIHHREARVITAREGARLQGFPDWFVFHATKWHAFRQIGNSVSPIVAECILRSIREMIQ